MINGLKEIVCVVEGVGGGTVPTYIKTSDCPCILTDKCHNSNVHVEVHIVVRCDKNGEAFLWQPMRHLCNNPPTPPEYHHNADILSV